PVASSIAAIDDPDGVRIVRERFACGGQQIVGHFGTYDRNITKLLLQSVPSLLRVCAGSIVLLMGRGSDAMRDALVRSRPELAERVYATGTLSAPDLSLHLKACDLMIQPYID